MVKERRSGTLQSMGLKSQTHMTGWDPPGPRNEPMSPASAGGFFTTEPPEKPSSSDFNGDFFPPYWGCIFPSLFICNSASLVAQTVKNSPAMQDTWV